MFSSVVSLALLGTAQFHLASAFSASGTNNLVLYWGQNSAGSQQSLASYCSSSVVDIIPISFLVAFGRSAYQLNFANACEGTNVPGSSLLQCDQIAADIKTCQAAGKKILLSMGGASGAYGFQSAAQAVQTANDMWNYFGGGSSSIRPFGSSQVDGFDLDIEDNNPSYYPEFIAQMRANYATQSAKTYYISGAPQCVYPDASLRTAMTDASFDFMFIQFYNNYCGIDHYGTSSFNYDQWDQWARTVSKNPNVRLYLGVPASTGAAGTGYVSPSVLSQAVSDLKSRYPGSFGGVMMWDASQAYANTPAGYSSNYAALAKQALGGTVTSSPTTQPAANPPGNVATTAPTTTAPAAANPGSSTGSCSQTYTVVSGDYCYAIYTKYGLSADTFYSLNPGLSAANNCPIQPGQVLCVGAGSNARTTTSITLTSTTTMRAGRPTIATRRPPIPTKAAGTSSPASGGSCPIAGGACTSGSYQCNGYGFAQCANGGWVLQNCPSGTACAGRGNNIYCANPNGASVSCAGIAGLTKREQVTVQDTTEVKTSMSTQRINATHFTTILKAVALTDDPIREWQFSFESDKQILEADQGILRYEGEGLYSIRSDPAVDQSPVRSLQVSLTGMYEKHAVSVPSKQNL